jgi:hypothetical protein
MAELKEGDRVLIIPQPGERRNYPWIKIGEVGVIDQIVHDEWAGGAASYIVKTDFYGALFQGYPEEIGLVGDSEWIEKMKIAEIEEVQDG